MLKTANWPKKFSQRALERRICHKPKLRIMVTLKKRVIKDTKQPTKKFVLWQWEKSSLCVLRFVTPPFSICKVNMKGVGRGLWDPGIELGGGWKSLECIKLDCYLILPHPSCFVPPAFSISKLLLSLTHNSLPPSQTNVFEFLG